ncbi:MAG: hypothetical protein CBB80_002575 [Synechococcus sp. TMED20]|jgi:hypothetical protein|nr:MAG: hypothetical protein CBB80_002575 [Synechococcus sp. TMED20]|tara:strand:+ start:1025 stop:1525 length:501 start_codon:yes stop_codon:yes gene_type:complete
MFRSVFALVFSLLGTMASQAQVLEETITNSGTNRVFQYAIQSTYGTQTSADATSNLLVEAEAVLNLKEDSFLTNTAGDVGGNTSAVFTTTPTGSNVVLSGITANNQYLLDTGTSFRTALTSTEPDGQPSIGQASATATHSMTITVTDGTTSFVNTLRENFEAPEPE